MSYLRLILRFLRCNILQTLRINFKMLPWRQAVHLPIFVYGRFKLRGTRGRIVLQQKAEAEMIIIGKRDYYVATAIPQSIWTINGTLTFAGRMKFAHGSYLLVADGAELSFGTGGTYCGTNFKVMCFEKIDRQPHHHRQGRTGAPRGDYRLQQLGEQGLLFFRALLTPCRRTRHPQSHRHTPHLGRGTAKSAGPTISLS